VPAAQFELRAITYLLAPREVRYAPVAHPRAQAVLSPGSVSADRQPRRCSTAGHGCLYTAQLPVARAASPRWLQRIEMGQAAEATAILSQAAQGRVRKPIRLGWKALTKGQRVSIQHALPSPTRPALICPPRRVVIVDKPCPPIADAAETRATSPITWRNNSIQLFQRSQPSVSGITSRHCRTANQMPHLISSPNAGRPTDRPLAVQKRASHNSSCQPNGTRSALDAGALRRYGANRARGLHRDGLAAVRGVDTVFGRIRHD